jgi:hypothetical protein
MEILRTFDGQYQGVYLARFVDCDFYQTPDTYETELDKIQDQLQDTLFVRNAISANHSGWKIGYYSNFALKTLALKVLREQADLFDTLDSIIQDAQTKDCLDVLLEHFKPLSHKEIYHDPSKTKMFTYDHDSLLRIYGVRVGNNSMIITGAGIKLADTMQQSKELELELQKMNHLIDWLNENNITDCEQF